jgi:hypothetical protein
MRAFSCLGTKDDLVAATGDRRGGRTDPDDRTAQIE